jgi:hypothetical protein
MTEPACAACAPLASTSERGILLGNIKATDN